MGPTLDPSKQSFSTSIIRVSFLLLTFFIFTFFFCPSVSVYRCLVRGVVCLFFLLSHLFFLSHFLCFPSFCPPYSRFHVSIFQIFCKSKYILSSFFSVDASSQHFSSFCRSVLHLFFHVSIAQMYSANQNKFSLLYSDDAPNQHFCNDESLCAYECNHSG